MLFRVQHVAAEFHQLWSLGNIDANNKFMTDNKELTQARLAVVQAVNYVITSGLHLLGIKAIEKM